MSERDIPPAVIDRILKTYDLMVSAAFPAVTDARDKVEAHIAQLLDAGETNPQRLTVSGLSYLRALGAAAVNSPADATLDAVGR
jgi:hypothetical protein